MPTLPEVPEPIPVVAAVPATVTLVNLVGGGAFCEVANPAHRAHVVHRINYYPLIMGVLADVVAAIEDPKRPFTVLDAHTVFIHLILACRQAEPVPQGSIGIP